MSSVLVTHNGDPIYCATRLKEGLHCHHYQRENAAKPVAHAKLPVALQASPRSPLAVDQKNARINHGENAVMYTLAHMNGFIISLFYKQVKKSVWFEEYK